jgi:hypothetical protein
VLFLGHNQVPFFVFRSSKLKFFWNYFWWSPACVVGVSIRSVGVYVDLASTIGCLASCSSLCYTD